MVYIEFFIQELTNFSMILMTLLLQLYFIHFEISNAMM
ncbi:hypothetical protein SAMN05428971_4324 [Candidatus Pantoea varia]|uniref:Uncharacterized protein n=1 Tax=Candidatus Pantoea varia TaxID=1881036 RepID=A0A1I5HUR6_9GAMM|nr:hypothetical protein SAMN05428971_4324 [Pantoea varia]